MGYRLMGDEHTSSNYRVAAPKEIAGPLSFLTIKFFQLFFTSMNEEHIKKKEKFS